MADRPPERIRQPFERLARPVTDRVRPVHLMLAVVLVALAIWVTREPWREIYELATTNAEYGHILLVPAIAAFLVYVRRLRLRHFRVTGRGLGAILVIVGWAMTANGYKYDIQTAWYGGAIAVALGGLVTALGKNAIFSFMPATLVLGFLVPVPQTIRLAIAQPLQEWTAWIANFLLDLVGVATQLTGATLSINGQLVRVAEACNGMRIVFPLILIAYAFSFGLPLRNRVRLILIIASPLVALLCNVIRTLPTVYLFGHDATLGRQFHDISGWAMLPIAFVILMLIIKTMRWAMLPIERYSLAGQGR